MSEPDSTSARGGSDPDPRGAELVSIEEAADHLQVFTSTIAEWIEQGILTVVTVGEDQYLTRRSLDKLSQWLFHERARVLAELDDDQEAAEAGDESAAQPVLWTREATRSLWLNYALAGAMAVGDYDALVELAHTNLRMIREANPRLHPHYLDRWEELLNGDPLSLLQAITAPTIEGQELRQQTPFAGVLDPETRAQVLTRFQHIWDRMQQSRSHDSAAQRALGGDAERHPPAAYRDTRGT